TGQVMKFVVGSLNGTDRSVPVSQLSLPALTNIGNASRTLRLSLNEMASAVPSFDAPVMGMLGTLNTDGSPNPLTWGAPLTERISRGATELWELHNFNEDAHPIHVHQTQLQ